MDKRVVKNSILMISLYGVTKVIGFVKEMLVANYYGATNITDAYNVVVTMSSTFFEGITTAVVVGYLVVVTNDRNKNKVNKITSQTISLFATLVFVISIMATIFAEQTCSVLAVGFDEKTMNLTVQMARMVLPFSALFVAKNVIGGYLQSKNIFWFTGASNLIMNLVLILSIVFSFGNSNILALGYSAATIIVWMVGWQVAKSNSFHFRYKLSWDSVMKEIVKLAIPVFITQTIVEFNLIVDRNFASILGTGMVSLFNYANKVYILFIAIFAQAFATAIFPDLSAAAKSMEKFKSMVKQSLEIIILVLFPVALFVMIKAHDIIEIVFLRGAFSQTDANITAQILKIYALAIPAVALTEMLNKCYYALNKAKIPMMAGGIGLVINVISNFAFIKIWGYIGLAIATVISSWGIVATLTVKLTYELTKFPKKEIFKNIGKITSATLLGGIGIWLVELCINVTKVDTFLKILIVGVEFLILMGLYLLLTYMMRIPYIKNINKIVRKISERIKRKG